MFVNNGITTSEPPLFSLSLFQIALAAGAPWGEFAMGGRFPGKLLSAMRIAALVHVVVLAFITFIVLARAGIVGSGFYGLSVKAIWAVAILMLVTSVIVALSPASF